MPPVAAASVLPPALPRGPVVNWWRGVVLGTLVAALAGVLAMLPGTHALEEDLGLGLLFRLRGAREAPPGVVVVAVHPTALQALDLPTHIGEVPRSVYATLIDALSAGGARAIAFDLSFARPSPDPAQDHRLAESLRHSGRVVLLDLLEQQPGPAGTQITRRLPPIPELLEAAAAHGPFLLPKAALVRVWWTRRAEADDAVTLPVLAARVAGAGVRLPPSPPGQDDARYLDFAGPPRTVATVDIDRVLRAASAGAAGAAWLRDTFAGRTVFVGYSAVHPFEQDRVRDDYQTDFTRPDGLALSGVEIAATAYANLLEGRTPQPLDLPAQLALLAGGGLLLGMACIALPADRALAMVVVTGAAYLGLATWRFAAAAQWLPTILPLGLQAPLALLGGVLWNHMDERRERRRLGALVDELVPPAVIAGLSGHLRLNDAPQRDVFGVVIMTDIEGFTTISERLSPACTTRLLNDYFGLIFPAVERHGGSVSQINGDAILAFWFAPAHNPAACRSACLAALEIANATRLRRAASQGPALPTRIGVHAGTITLARIGASRHHEYRAVGDAANTVSRIEALSKHLGTRLLVSDAVTAGLDGFLLRPLGRFVLAGKSMPVSISELLAHEAGATPVQRRCCALFAQALEDYGARRWHAAAARWSALLREFPEDGPSRFYLRLVEHCIAAQPPDWDPVVHMETK